MFVVKSMLSSACCRIYIIEDTYVFGSEYKFNNDSGLFKMSNSLFKISFFLTILFLIKQKKVLGDLKSLTKLLKSKALKFMTPQRKNTQN